ncbi:copper-binding protein [Novosphingobium sp. EMRT-2]|uniref:copper-binding protein n=1 Tax=Novosphingobium sp. EMRT-2 TaxID=2571749 RepID=UPI0010BDEEFD|nr:copper-binding protein [Novosphingobium sp. EMRT-2]QCI92376.1 copper-binding protein [Novosphingobium sp. EMRT-2]
MKKTLMIAALVILPIALSACGKKAEQPAPVATPAMDKQAMDAMTAPAAPRTGSGEGKVVSVNASTGAITIEHGPIKQIDWPAMTMGFTAKPELLKGIAAGDKVAFEIKGSGENYEVVSIRKE